MLVNLLKTKDRQQVLLIASDYQLLRLIFLESIERNKC